VLYAGLGCNDAGQPEAADVSVPCVVERLEGNKPAGQQEVSVMPECRGDPLEAPRAAGARTLIVSLEEREALSDVGRHGYTRDCRY